ncbi:putative mitochondrial import receptor subunit protein [Phaeoacremonium minimum UCRPA7]|uniref:Putative mitochondrial import receptor subunit protein n=1 Tax=Phaeoacremonium minimum (strain UCR-PA7) TaxID=1286976 RepID=R8BV86_PHAM7|nr:putative mitochondrial import receptor subunit protein [Phaeoacremonium minimum UCRPA7]EOO03235.1 putative mitochondrial import receptor subunit protein [Phaeoacremonium minimum UCRPA7]
MVLQVHVWGPAFGLPSIDAECLAVITYLAYAAPGSNAWTLAASSPSAVPGHALPALYDTETQSWITGFSDIVTYLGSQNLEHDLDVDLTSAQKADSTPYSVFLATNASPLVALSLYVSSANWAGTTRPAYSKILTFPLTWTEPTAVRSAMAQKAEHLGLSSLDTDSEATSSSESGAAAADDSGFFHIPKSLQLPKRGVSAALSPEQTAQIRLDAVASDCLSVLAELKGDKKFLLRDGRPTALDCLAFGYLALMLVPEVPRPWLQTVLRKRYGGLCAFVEEVRRDCFGERVLPWSVDRPSRTVLSISSRFAHGAMRVFPVFGEDWHRWMVRRRKADSDKGKPWDGGRDTNAIILAVCGGLTGAALLGGALLYRHLMPFGSPLYRYERERRGLAGFGAAGSFLGISSEWMDSQYNQRYGGGNRSAAPRGGIEVDYQSVPINDGGHPPIVELDVEVAAQGNNGV